MATLLEQLDSIPMLANSQTWCLFRQRIEQRDTQRKLILIIVCVALLLDNMLYMVIVPIIPDYLRQIGAWTTHKEGGKIEYKQVNTTSWTTDAPNAQSLISQLERTAIVNSSTGLQTLNDSPNTSTKPPDEQDSAEDEYYYKTNKDDDDIELNRRSDNLKEETNRSTSKQRTSNHRNHTYTLAVRTGSHTVYEGEDSAIGMLFASKAIVQLIVNPFSGAIIDRLGYDRPLCFGLSVLFLSTAMFAVSRSYEVLFFARSLQGVGSAFADTASFAMIADRFTEPDQREKALGIALSFVSFGCLAAPPFGSFLYEFFGKQLPFIVLSLICLLDGFMVILIMAPIKKQESNESRIRRTSANYAVTSRNSNTPTTTTTKLNHQHSTNGSGGQYQLNRRHSLITTTADQTPPQGTPIYVLLKDRFIAVCAGALVMANISLACLEPTISIWMQDTMQDIENWQLGMIWLPSFFPYVFGVYFTVNYNRKYPQAQYLIAICGLALTGLSCLVIPLATNYYQLFLPIAVLCFGVAVIDTAVFPLLAFIVDTRYVSVYGSVYAIADISYSVAYASGPVVAGNIMATFGFTFLNIFIAILVAAYCPVLLSLRHINEYSVIDENNVESLSKHSSKPSSLDENSIEENQISMDTNAMNNYRTGHLEYSRVTAGGGVKMGTSIFSSNLNDTAQSYRPSKPTIGQSTELTKMNYVCNYE